MYCRLSSSSESEGVYLLRFELVFEVVSSSSSKWLLVVSLAIAEAWANLKVVLSDSGATRVTLLPRRPFQRPLGRFVEVTMAHETGIFEEDERMLRRTAWGGEENSRPSASVVFIQKSSHVWTLRRTRPTYLSHWLISNIAFLGEVQALTNQHQTRHSPDPSNSNICLDFILS